MRRSNPIAAFALLLPVVIQARAAQPSAPAAHKAGLTCGACHAAQAAPQSFTPMAQALQVPGRNRLLLSHPEMDMQSGPYRYSVRTREGVSTYSVSDGKRTVEEPIRWAFGLRTQTFVLEHDGRFYESLVSYYDEIDRLDTTIGDQAIQPVTLDEAFGRPLATSEVTACFGCHSTNAVHDGKLTLSTAQPGVACEHCHSGAAVHQQTVTSHTATPIQIKSAVPERLGARSAEGISNFCGQCHRSWDTVVRNNWFGQMNVRFQPYRLATSKCFDGADARSSCTACHNPHENLVKESKSYDAKCLACHVTNGVSVKSVAVHLMQAREDKPGKACPVAQENCVSCHMPKVSLPGGHQSFSDHQIRIPRPGAPYPN